MLLHRSRECKRATLTAAPGACLPFWTFALETGCKFLVILFRGHSSTLVIASTSAGTPFFTWSSRTSSMDTSGSMQKTSFTHRVDRYTLKTGIFIPSRLEHRFPTVIEGSTSDSRSRSCLP